jgi:hypothetical protein
VSLQVGLSIIGVLCSTGALVCAAILFLGGHRMRAIAIGAWNVAILAVLFWWLLR